MPAISIIMPAYNAEKYISDAIESILNQSFSDFELIICDDGSTDKTLSVIKKYAETDKRVRVLINKKNIGNLKTTNRLLAECTGEYIAIQDADDVSDINRLFVQQRSFKQNENLGIVGTYFYLIDGDGEIFNCGLLPQTHNEITCEMKKEVAPFLYPSVMVKRTVAERVGGFRVFFNRIGYADFDWMARIVEISEGCNINSTLYSYRKHESQFTANESSKRDLFLSQMHPILVEAHEQRLRGETDFIDRNDVWAMRKFVSGIYLKQAEQLYWQGNKVACFRELAKAFKIFPFNLSVFRTTLYIIRK